LGLNTEFEFELLKILLPTTCWFHFIFKK